MEDTMSDLETQGQQAAEEYWGPKEAILKDADYLKGFLTRTIELASEDGMEVEIILNDILDEMEEEGEGVVVESSDD
jgi:hypothetical protein